MEQELDESLKRDIIVKLKKMSYHKTNGVTIGPGSQKVHQVKCNTPKKEVSILPNNDLARIKSSQHEQGLSRRQLMQLLELERQKEAHSALNARLNVFKHFDKVLEDQSKQSRCLAQKTAIEDMELQEKQIIEADQHYDASQSKTLSEMTHLREVSLKRMQDRQNMLLAAKRKLVSEQLVKQISVNILKFYEEMKKTVRLANSLDKTGKPLSTFVQINNNLLETLNTTVQALVGKCNIDHANLTEEDVITSENLLSKATELYNDYKTQVDDFKFKQAESEKNEELKENRELPEQIVHKPVQAPVAPGLTIGSKVDTEITAVTVSKDLSEDAQKLSKYVSVKDLQKYENLLSFTDKFKKSFEQLENDPSLKIFRFDCKKAINIPVNSLSGVNAEHILDKYKKLHSLLSGQTVIVADKQVNAARHPQGIAFCMDLLAKKFVLQGDIMVSSSPESAFSYASVILSLWNDFPELGQLILAYFFQMCPYLVPYYMPKQVGESEEEFYKKLGYQYNNDGEIEKQDKFLKRMTGIMRLYFALTIVKPKTSQSSSPYDLRNSWKWLSSFLKLEPQLDITATALHVFLETVGFQMKAVYGVTFNKIMQIIVKMFIPKCQKAQCTGGAVTRLELLVNDYLQKNSFETPYGYNEKPFW